MPITVLVLAAIAAGAILLIFLGLAGGSSVDPVQARLTQLGSMQAKNLEELELQQPFIERTLRPLAARLSGTVSRVASTSFTERTEKRLALAGNPGDLRVADWLGIKAIGAIVGGVIFFVLFVVIGVLGFPFLIGLLMSGVGLLFGYTIPEFWLGGRVRKRQKAILLMIPDTLDLLTISVRAGLGFDAALGRVVEKLKGPLTDEFRRALAEVRVGKTRREALRDIVPRTEVPPLTNFIGAIIQAEQLGVSISKVLQVQSEQLRIERRQRAEEQAAKAPIKMLFPLVGCIFPSLFIVILGPAIILIIQNLTLEQSGPIRATEATTMADPAALLARNDTRGTVLADRVEVAASLWGKFRGLMGRASLADGAALWLPESNGIHMMFMRFPIDAVFVGRPDDSAGGARRVISVHPAPRRVDRPRAARARRARRPGAAGRHHRPDRHGRRRPDRAGTRHDRISGRQAAPATVPPWPDSATWRPAPSIWRSRPSASGADARATRSAGRARRHSTRGWTCRAGPRSGSRPTCRRRCSRSSGARRMPGSSAMRSTRSSTPGNGASPCPSARRSRGAGPGRAPAATSSSRYRSTATGRRPVATTRRSCSPTRPRADSGSRCDPRSAGGTPRSPNSSWIAGPGR